MIIEKGLHTTSVGRRRIAQAMYLSELAELEAVGGQCTWRILEPTHAVDTLESGIILQSGLLFQFGLQSESDCGLY